MRAVSARSPPKDFSVTLKSQRPSPPAASGCPSPHDHATARRATGAGEPFGRTLTRNLRHGDLTFPGSRLPVRRGWAFSLTAYGPERLWRHSTSGRLNGERRMTPGAWLKGQGPQSAMSALWFPAGVPMQEEVQRTTCLSSAGLRGRGWAVLPLCAHSGKWAAVLGGPRVQCLPYRRALLPIGYLLSTQSAKKLVTRQIGSC